MAVTGEPFLVDIPGKMIDYVPDVAAKAGIDVPGQYYEILPKFYVFIPSQRSESNLNVQPPDAEDKPLLEAYVRAEAAVWEAFTSDPVPVAGSKAMSAAYTEHGLSPLLQALDQMAQTGARTVIRDGNFSAPWVNREGQTQSYGEVLDCRWLNQYDLTSDGATQEDYDERRGASADVVKKQPGWLVDRFNQADWGCR